MLTRGKVAVIDLCDVERVSAHTWCAKKGDRTWYARAQRRNDDSAKTKIYLARLILDPPPDAWVEHINGDGLDNRRSSLRLRTSGDIQSTFAFVERFWAKVQKSDGCWNWTAGRSRGGYGKLGVNGHHMTAHRVSWLLHHGSISKGLCVLHRCDNRRCVRPDHLFLGTAADNVWDCVRKGRNAGAKGEKNGCAKLTQKDVVAIRASSANQLAVARLFGVGQSAVSSIKRRKRWGHVPEATDNADPRKQKGEISCR